MTQQMARLDIPPDPGIKSIAEVGKIRLDFAHWMERPEKTPVSAREPRLDCGAALYAWFNARLLGLDPVFADKKTWQWASGIKFREETKANLTTDLMSIDILPLGRKKCISVQDIVSMRKGERVFGHIRKTLIGCKEHVRNNVSEGASSEFISKTCREYVRDNLNPGERLKAIKFLDKNLAAGTVLSVAISAAFMATNPLFGLLVPAVLTPKALLAVKARFDPKVRAAVQLDALL